MNPQEAFCPNHACPARGQSGQGNIGVHSQSDERFICHECGKTFSATLGTLFYRLRTPPATVLLVIALLANGCPLAAIVQAFGFDERTVKNWWLRAGVHCEHVHAQLVGQSQLDLQHVQADELKVNSQGGVVWMATALMVSTRLWLGGAISARRDGTLIATLVAQIHSSALCRPLLLAVDGLASYVSAFRRAFRSPLPRQGRAGRSRLRPWDELAIVQVVKSRAATAGGITRRIVQGAPLLVMTLLQASQGGGGINTAYIERLNATFRQRLCWLGRRTRHRAQQVQTLHAGMFILGCVYNFCDYHASLRVRLWISATRGRWLHRTPAIAAGLTDHCWSLHELFTYKLPPPRWSPPPQRGRRSKQLQRTIDRWCPDLHV